MSWLVFIIVLLFLSPIPDVIIVSLKYKKWKKR
jgi:hypothetical protein